MITTGISAKYLLDLAAGIHKPTDTYKLALYRPTASLSPSTAVYSAAHEVPAHGAYKMGGCVLSGFVVDEKGICFDYPCFENTTIDQAAGALIYNASKGDRAVVVIKFKEPVSSLMGTFDVDLPSPVVPLT